MNIVTCDTLFPHFDILPKTRSKVTTATTFSRQNDAGSRALLRKSRTRSRSRLRI